jgi:uncharacterized protein (TIRG00374 family)
LPTTRLRAIAQEVAPASRSPRPARSRLVPLLWLVGGAVVALVVALHRREVVHAADGALRANLALVALGALLEVGSLAGYVVLLHRVVSRANPTVRLRDSYDITMAGTATTRMLPTAGLGGTAVTVWALRARGVQARELAERLLAFMLLLYAVYMFALFGSGAAVALGLVHVSGGRALGVLGAILALTVASTTVSLLASPSLVRKLLKRVPRRSGRFASALHRAEECLPALRTALRRAWLEMRGLHPALLGAVAWWGFDIAVLAAMLHSFGVALPVEAVVLAYFLGTFCNLLPIPGSVSGGLAGALVVLGAPTTHAVAAVLAYRAIAVWLPATSGVASLPRLWASVTRWRSEGPAHPIERASFGTMQVVWPQPS